MTSPLLCAAWDSRDQHHAVSSGPPRNPQVLRPDPQSCRPERGAKVALENAIASLTSGTEGPGERVFVVTQRSSEGLLTDRGKFLGQK